MISPGGLTDAIVASLALLVVVFSPAYLWRRLRLVPEWLPFRPVALIADKACLASFLLFSVASISGVAQGLAERVLVTICSLWLAALAAAWLAIRRRAGDPRPVAVVGWTPLSRQRGHLG